MSGTISNTPGIGHVPPLPGSAAQAPVATPTTPASRHLVKPETLGALAAGRPGRMAGQVPLRTPSAADLPKSLRKTSVASNNASKLLQRLDDTIDLYQPRLPAAKYQELKQRVDTLRTASPPTTAANVKAEMTKMHGDLLHVVDHAPAPNELPRVPTEIATHWMAGLKQKIDSLPPGDSHLPALNTEYANAQRKWMSHDLNTGAVHSMLDSAIKENHPADIKKLAQQLDNEIAKHGGKEPPTTRLFDNVYGRTFESALVDHLVKNPPTQVKQAMSQLGQSLSGSVENIHTTTHINWFGTGLKNAQDLLKKDTRVWSNELGASNPAYAKFLAHTLPTPQFLPPSQPNQPSQPIPLSPTEVTQIEDGTKLLKQALQAPTQTGTECIARPYMAVKLMIGFRNAHCPFAGQAEADANYVNNIGGPSGRTLPLITPSPALAPPPFQHLDLSKPAPFTDGAGITLLHQPDAAKGPASGAPASRPGHINEPAYPFFERPESEGLSRVMQNSLLPHREMTLAHENGIPYVSGVSGSTNLAVLYVIKTNKNALAQNPANPPPIDAPSATLGAVMFLNHDGGHSIHEALWTANQTEPALNHGSSAQATEQNPAQFKSDYHEYFSTFDNNPETKAALHDATQYAFNKIIELRHDHVSDNAFVR